MLFRELAKRMMDVGVLTLFCWGDQESETFWTKQVFVDYFLSHSLILLCFAVPPKVVTYLCLIMFDDLGSIGFRGS